MVVLLLQSCQNPVAISCRNARTEGPKRSGICGTAWCRETDCKHKVGSDRQEVPPRAASDEASENTQDSARWDGDAINELQWYQFRHTKARNLILERD